VVPRGRNGETSSRGGGEDGCEIGGTTSYTTHSKSSGHIYRNKTLSSNRDPHSNDFGEYDGTLKVQRKRRSVRDLPPFFDQRAPTGSDRRNRKKKEMLDVGGGGGGQWRDEPYYRKKLVFLTRVLSAGRAVFRKRNRKLNRRPSGAQGTGPPENELTVRGGGFFSCGGRRPEMSTRIVEGQRHS